MAFDLQRFLDELAAWVDAAGRPVAVHRYGAHPEQFAELRLPDGAGPFPVAVVLHGGFWRARYTLKNTRALAVDLAARGWATWNVEYRRVGCDGGVPETLDDVSAAVTALAGLGAPLDRSRVVALGHSAGGQLALWAAVLEEVTAAVSLGGVCDLVAAARLGIGDGAAAAFAGGLPGAAPQAYALADPMRRLPTGTPTLVVHGSDDDRVPIELSRAYAAAAAAAGDPAELLELPGVGHFEPIDPRSTAWRAVAARVGRL